MNRKLIIFLIILCASFLTISSVSADDYQNFDNYFLMKAPKEITFEKEINTTNENGLEQISATYISENVVIMYLDSPACSDNSSEWCYQTIFEQLNPEAIGCYESQEDNLTVLETTTNDPNEFSLVGVSNGNKILIVVGDDLDLIKGMGRSVKFK